MNFSLKDKHMVVAYHYVQDPDSDFLAIHPCSVKEFERQIKFLSENYRVASVEEVFGAAKEKSGERLCAITFDDGTRDQYQNAVPILEKYNAAATFFIIAKTLEGNFLPVVHKVYILLSKIDIEDAIGMFNDLLKKHYPALLEKFFVPKDKGLPYSKRYGHDRNYGESNLKDRLASAPDEVKDDFLIRIFKEKNIFEKGWVEKIFMNKNEVKDLMSRGFQIGNHTAHHKALDVLDENKIDEEIKMANEYYRRILNKKPVVFSYPWGRNNQVARDVLKKNGIKYAVTIERECVSSDVEPLMISRYDTNDIRDFLNL